MGLTPRLVCVGGASTAGSLRTADRQSPDITICASRSAPATSGIPWIIGVLSLQLVRPAPTTSRHINVKPWYCTPASWMANCWDTGVEGISTPMPSSSLRRFQNTLLLFRVWSGFQPSVAHAAGIWGDCMFSAGVVIHLLRFGDDESAVESVVAKRFRWFCRSAPR